jgi:NAD(P)-dependent dehydrogenase (short-subunit alcohol dehydrogenase family)
MRLADEVALITGSTKGIGRAIAVMFAREGAKVVVTGRSTEQGAAVEKEIHAAGGKAIFVRTDMGREDDVTNAVRSAVDAFGKLTVLVNNAAPTAEVAGWTTKVDGVLTEISNETWEYILRVGLTGVFWACKHAIPEMARAGRGSIINISSAASVEGSWGVTGYTAVKSAMNGLTRSIAVECAGENIRANTVLLGAIESNDIISGILADPVAGPVLRSMHLTRIGVPEDVAYACVFLASGTEAGYITGSLFCVDGGMTCRNNFPTPAELDILRVRS